MTDDGLPHQVLEFFRSYGNVGTEPSQLLGYASDEPFAVD
jgi:hypothetical protein